MGCLDEETSPGGQGQQSGAVVVGVSGGEGRAIEVAEGVEMEFCWVPPGHFLMGSEEDELGRYGDEGPVAEVVMTRGFWLGKYAVMQGEWKAVMGSQPSRFDRDRVGVETTRHPVEQVSWLDICGDEGRRGGFLGRVNLVAPEGWRFDLPSEAEWEYACRAGARSALNSGEELASTHGWCRNLGRVAWYDANSGGRTHEVGELSPNAWGLYDMHGNVWEWCRDCYRDSYDGHRSADPEGPPGGAWKVYRGGSFANNARRCRSAYRIRYGPGLRFRGIGFRLSLRPSP